VEDPHWDQSVAFLREDVPHLPGAIATADLLERARPSWENKVVARTSMLDLLFTRPEEAFPWAVTVRVERVGEDAFQFELVRDYHLITADRATDENALAVLDAFLMQLTAT
jgi:hypothetical protein